jgi:hypothetical protein
MSFRSSVRSFLFLSLLATSAVTAQAESQSWKNIGPIQSGDVSAYVDYQVSFSVLSFGEAYPNFWGPDFFDFALGAAGGDLPMPGRARTAGCD